MKALLIDDEVLALDVLEIELNKLDDIEIVGKYQDPELAFNDLAKLEVEVIFMDMNMGEVHGIELAEKVKKAYSHIEVIFVTAHAEFALEAFEVNAIDYLLKPVNLNRLRKAVLKTTEKLALNKIRKDIAIQTTEDLYAYTMKSFRFLDSKGNVIKWRTRKVKELFVYLLHYRPAHKAKIIEDLWPDSDVSKSMVLLHTTVYHLRKLLKENGLVDPLKLVNDSYILSLTFQCDFIELEEQVQSNVTPENVIKVLELYQGDYLEEDNYEWAMEIQQTMKQSVLQFLEKFIDEPKFQDKHPFLVEDSLEKMLEIDLYNETNMLKLMKHYSRVGNRQRMEELYEIIRERLEVDLSIHIPNEIEELYKVQFV